MRLRYISVVFTAAILVFLTGGARAQIADPRLIELEEQVRQLTGRIEELNFQILQMQEQLRKTQEDNEFRFQELEQKSGDAGRGGGNVKAAGDPAQAARNSQQTPPASGETGNLGAAPKTLGTITLDAHGNIVSGSLTDPTEVIRDGNSGTDNSAVAALPATDDAGQLYQNAYEFILSGDYRTAEAGFREHIERFPDDPQTADARYWLGEALLGQERYREAAEIFLAASQDYPDAQKSPDMLLKLGVSLVALDQRKVACATFSEAEKRYSNTSKAFRDRLKQEQQSASC